jgi:hypothetical protein
MHSSRCAAELGPNQLLRNKSKTVPAVKVGTKPHVACHVVLTSVLLHAGQGSASTQAAEVFCCIYCCSTPRQCKGVMLTRRSRAAHSLGNNCCLPWTTVLLINWLGIQTPRVGMAYAYGNVYQALILFFTSTSLTCLSKPPAAVTQQQPGSACQHSSTAAELLTHKSAQTPAVERFSLCCSSFDFYLLLLFDVARLRCRPKSGRNGSLTTGRYYLSLCTCCWCAWFAADPLC